MIELPGTLEGDLQLSGQGFRAQIVLAFVL